MKNKKNPGMATPLKQRSMASINLDDKMKLPNLRVGTKVTVELTGKVTRVSDEEYGRGLSMDITSIETDSMREDMHESKRSRRMSVDMDDEY